MKYAWIPTDVKSKDKSKHAHTHTCEKVMNHTSSEWTFDLKTRRSHLNFTKRKLMFFLKIWCLIILISKIFLKELSHHLHFYFFTFLATVIRLLHFLHCGTTVSIKSHTFIMNWTFEYYFCSVNALITQNVLRTRPVLSYWILWHIMADSWWKCEGWSHKQESYEKAVTWQVRSLINTTDALNRRNSVTAN